MKKKLLIISHNIIDNSNNVGKTVISLLKKWPKEDVFSIYLRNEIRPTMLCDNSYMISDRDVLAGLLHFSSAHCGKIQKADRKSPNLIGDSGAYRMGNKRYPIVSLVRDLIWHSGIWKTRRLREWVKSVNPDVILFVPNDYTLAFEILEYVLPLTNARLYTFFTDDSFYYNQHTGIIDQLRRKWLRNIGQRVVNKTNGMITASDLMKLEYKEVLGKDSIVLGNCVEISEYKDQCNSFDRPVLNISYIGNLHSNRWQCLIDIADALVSISQQIKQTVHINVYTASDLDDSILSRLKSYECIKFHGSIPSSEVRKVQESSDALLHIEAFDYKSKVSTRLSMSTKIFEYMARQIPMFAYGPHDISSMCFIASGPYGMSCTSKEKLQQSLIEFIKNKSKRDEICDRAYRYAKANFKEDIISHRCYEFLK